jgi:hypothetical protein
VSDEDLRALEKRARAGDADAGTSWLAARRRLGTISAERIEVAAYAGDEAARQLVLAERAICECNLLGKKHGRPCPLAGRSVAETKGALRIPRATWRWLTHFPAHREALACVALAVLPFAGPLPEHPLGEVIAGLEPAVRSWLACPCEAHFIAIETARDRGAEISPEHFGGTMMGGPLAPGMLEDWHAVYGGFNRWDLAVQAVVEADPGSILAPLDELAQSLVRARRTTEAELRGAIRASVVDWALGGASAEPSLPQTTGERSHLVARGSDLKRLRDAFGWRPGILAMALDVPDRRVEQLERRDDPLPEALAERAEAFLGKQKLLARARRILKKRAPDRA